MPRIGWNFRWRLNQNMCKIMSFGQFRLKHHPKMCQFLLGPWPCRQLIQPLRKLMSNLPRLLRLSIAKLMCFHLSIDILRLRKQPNLPSPMSVNNTIQTKHDKKVCFKLYLRRKRICRWVDRILRESMLGWHMGRPDKAKMCLFMPWSTVNVLIKRHPRVCLHLSCSLLRIELNPLLCRKMPHELSFAWGQTLVRPLLSERLLRLHANSVLCRSMPRAILRRPIDSNMCLVMPYHSASLCR